MQKLFELVKNFSLNKNLQIYLHLFTVKQRQSLKTKPLFIIYDIFYFGFTYIRTTELFRLTKASNNYQLALRLLYLVLNSNYKTLGDNEW